MVKGDSSTTAQIIDLRRQLAQGDLTAAEVEGRLRSELLAAGETGSEADLFAEIRRASADITARNLGGLARGTERAVAGTEAFESILEEISADVERRQGRIETLESSAPALRAPNLIRTLSQRQNTRLG